MEEWILSLIYWLKDLSYVGIVLGLSIEAVPGEIILPLAGFWVSEGDFYFWGVVLAGILGGTMGPMTLYALGRFGGRPVVERFGKYFLIRPHHIAVSDRFFERYGAKVAFFGRFVPLVRTAISIPCGMTKMNPAIFALYTALGVTPITILYVWVGMKLGTHWEEASTLIEPYIRWVAIAGVLLLVGYVFIRYCRRSAKKALS